MQAEFNHTILEEETLNTKEPIQGRVVRCRSIRNVILRLGHLRSCFGAQSLNYGPPLDSIFGSFL